MNILVHNISHSDFVLEINEAKEGKQSSYRARPRYNSFKALSQAIYTKLQDEGEIQVRYLPASSNSAGDIVDSIPIGFELKSSLKENSESLRIQKEYAVDNDGHDTPGSVFINKVYFPLLAVLIPKWLKEVQHSGQRRIVLVSGRGSRTAAHQNEDDVSKDNSTEVVGQLMSIFIRKVLPDVTVELLHSSSNLFRYDENILFVKLQLLPLIDGYRDEMVLKYGENWKNRMRLTLSFADGSTARISAINASLRHYRPSYLHFWRLKTFWRDYQIDEDDIEWHSYEEISTDAAFSTRILTPDHSAYRIIKEMMAFKEEFLRVSRTEDHELKSFWLRKTEKPVLAIVLIEKDGVVKTYRATNMEVSMPTGSLCAERNAIGSALAENPSLTRKQIKQIAVYSINPKEWKTSSDGAKARSDSNMSDRAVEVAGPFLSTVDDIGTLALRNTQSRQCAVVDGVHGEGKSRSESTLSENSMMVTDLISPRQADSPMGEMDTMQVYSMKGASERSPASKRRKIELLGRSYQRQVAFVAENCSRPKMTTIDAVENDMNPLKPCGACNEWLKKIAEVNPALSIVTFTDTNFQGFYCEQVSEC